MNLFDGRINGRFFNPLSAKNKSIYYDCISLLIDKTRRVSVFYESEAVDTILLYLRNCKYAVYDESYVADSSETLISSKSTESENAVAIIKYFRFCGWLTGRELSRSGENTTAVTPACRKLIEAVDRIFRCDTGSGLTNHIFSIYDILHSAFIPEHGRTARPYGNILSPISAEIDELRNDLISLKDNIRTIMSIVIRMTETNQLGQFLLKDTMMESFFSDYFFMRKGGLIPGYIAEIEKMLRRIRNKEIYAAIINDYARTKRTDEKTAAEEVEEELGSIQNYIISEYPKQMAFIDRRINNYYRLYSASVSMILNNNTNMQTFLSDILLNLKKSDLKEREAFFEALPSCSDLQSFMYIDRKSLVRRKTVIRSGESGAIQSNVLSEEDRNRLTHDIFEKEDKYGLKKTVSYFDSLMKGCNILIPDDSNIQSREDAMMMASCVIYSGSDEFPYAIEFDDTSIDTSVAKFRNIKLVRKMNGDNSDHTEGAGNDE